MKYQATVVYEIEADDDQDAAERWWIIAPGIDPYYRPVLKEISTSLSPAVPALVLDDDDAGVRS